MTDHIADLQRLTNDELRTLGRWLEGIRGPGVVDPELPMDPEAEPSEARPTGVRDWANDRLTEVLREHERRLRQQRVFDDNPDGITPDSPQHRQGEL